MVFDHEEGPPAKSAAALDTRPGYAKRTLRDSPDVRDCDLSLILRCAKSEEFYYHRLDAYKRDLANHEREVRLHKVEVDKTMDIFLSMLSESMQEKLQKYIASRDLAVL
jgi:hypothetical protein